MSLQAQMNILDLQIKMNNLNSLHEAPFEDFDYICFKIGKAYVTGTSLQDLALENRIPVSTIQEIVNQYQKIHS